MRHAIAGFDIGQALARAFAREGIEVSVAATRDPESFASAAATIGPTIIPRKLAEVESWSKGSMITFTLNPKRSFPCTSNLQYPN